MRSSSQLSKENHYKEVKNEFSRADLLDCNDQMEDDVDDQKLVGRSGRRPPLSMTITNQRVAERKYRKKLTERLYALRALVPKITKMDTASILRDASDYITQLQQQLKELQDELKEMDMQPGNPESPPDLENGGQQAIDEETIARCSAKSDVTKPAANEMVHYIQIEVIQLDTHVFDLRIFSENRVDGFVRLMQAMDRLGLDILNFNITSFKGLVLNVFNVEMRDKKMNIQADQLKESLLEMMLNPSSAS
ncbi:hypothetical protein KI387_022046, partial [Taxus chinensis]